jgi:LysM repeat protein
VIAGIVLSSATIAGSASADDYVVQPGETLSEIAARFGLPVETLLDVNGLPDADAVHAGEVIRIPTALNSAVAMPAPDAPADDGSDAAAPALTSVPLARSYTVRPGDTLSGIAALYGVTTHHIADANGLDDHDHVVAGSTIVVPGAGETQVAAPAPAATESGAVHTVSTGEVLSAIAERYGVRLEMIIAANGLPNPDLVHPGQDLVIPGAADTGAGTGAASSVVHVVAAGETLSSIAARYGIDLSRLADANNLADHDFIVSGERILIPGAFTPSQTTGYDGLSVVIELGDTLSALAAEHGVTMETIIAANGLDNPNLLIPGQSLDIPGGSSGASSPPADTAIVGNHVVATGETLASIAARYGVSASVIIEANSLANPNHIVVGQALSIPGAAPGRQYSLAEYQAILENAAAEFGVSAALIKALAWQESGWNQFVISYAGAVGLMQVMPYTADWALLTLVPDAVAWETDPVANARMGTAILHHWLVRSDGNIETALGAYYQGWRSLHEIGVYEDTVQYIASILALVPQFE